MFISLVILIAITGAISAKASSDESYRKVIKTMNSAVLKLYNERLADGHSNSNLRGKETADTSTEVVYESGFISFVSCYGDLDCSTFGKQTADTSYTFNGDGCFQSEDTSSPFRGFYYTFLVDLNTCGSVEIHVHTSPQCTPETRAFVFNAPLEEMLNVSAGCNVYVPSIYSWYVSCDRTALSPGILAKSSEMYFTAKYDNNEKESCKGQGLFDSTLPKGDQAEMIQMKVLDYCDTGKGDFISSGKPFNFVPARRYEMRVAEEGDLIEGQSMQPGYQYVYSEMYTTNIADPSQRLCSGNISYEGFGQLTNEEFDAELGVGISVANGLPPPGVDICDVPGQSGLLGEDTYGWVKINDNTARIPLWGECTNVMSLCIGGTHCQKINPYYSQCQESEVGYVNFIEITGSTEHCVKTNNGPWSYPFNASPRVKNWGCDEETPCCNPFATCSNHMCMLYGAVAGGDSSQLGKLSASNDAALSGSSMVVLVPVVAGVGLFAILASLSLYYFICRRGASTKSQGYENQSELTVSVDSETEVHVLE